MSFHLAEGTIFVLHNEGDAFYLKNFIFWFWKTGDGSMS